MSNVDSWWKKVLKFLTPLPQEKSKPVVQKEVYEKAWKEATVVLKKFDDEPKRARGSKGRYKADDKSTANINEAWEGGKAPKKDKKPAAKKTKVTRIKKKK